ncbi:MAG: NosD domain-containing protein [Methanomassiliicoccales archaeon]
MNDPKFKVTAVFFILILLSIMPLATTSANSSVTLMEGLVTTSHPTIAVYNDTQLSELIASNGWSGNGTEGNPYVIEGLDIDARGGTNAIFIGSTAQHLIIRGCYLHNTTISFGMFPYNGNCGATIYNASNVTLEQNVCTGNGRGLALYQSTDVTVRNNTCYGNIHGIGLYYSNGNLLIGNNCTSDSNDGIHFEVSSSNVIEDNRCIMNSRYGLCLVGDSNSNLVANNTIGNNSNSGIRLSSLCNLNSIVGNLVAGNLAYGIHIISSNGNQIHGNVILENRGATSEFNSSKVQGYDSGNNLWNSTSNGNRWGDWSEPDANGDGFVDVAYKMDGGSNHDQKPIALTYVQILQPSDGETVNTSTVIVSGIADHDYTISINGALVRVEDDGSFSYALSLIEGLNPIEVRSLNPSGEVSDHVNVTYVNQLRIDLEELQDRMDEMDRRVDGLAEALNGAMDGLDAAMDGLNAAMENITSLGANLNDTQARLSQTREWLQAVEDQLADCYGDLNLTAEEVGSLLEQVSSLRTSLIELRDSLNLTDEQAVALEAALNAAIADLSSAEDRLESLQSDVGELQEDRLPLMLGLAGLIMGALALVLFALIYARKIKLS